MAIRATFGVLALGAYLALAIVAIAGGDEQVGAAPSATPATEMQTSVDEALRAADRDLRRRGRRGPDARYVAILERTLMLRRETSYTRTTDVALLQHGPFVSNLRKLFEAQSSAHLAPTELSLGNRFIVGGLPIPSATDVVGITADEAGGLGASFCSGVKVAQSLVVTAAHCVCTGAANFVRVGERMRDRAAYHAYRVVRRRLWLDQEFCPTRRPDETLGRFLVRVQEATRGQDLAVLEVAEEIAGGQPRRVLDRGQFDVWRGEKYHYFVRAAGVGFSGISPLGQLEGAGLRLYADIAVASHRCSAEDAKRFKCEKGKELVAQGHPAHKLQGPTPHTCSGDSGGPIFALVEQDGEKRWYLVGVTSRGTSAACGAGGIYTLVSTAATLEWLKARGAIFLE